MRMPASLRLTVITAPFIGLWGGVLPRLEHWAPVARHIQVMEAGRVNPAAMYYTELDHLPVRPAWLDRRIVLWP